LAPAGNVTRTPVVAGHHGARGRARGLRGDPCGVRAPVGGAVEPLAGEHDHHPGIMSPLGRRVNLYIRPR
jgi:hypothetical protein